MHVGKIFTVAGVLQTGTQLSDSLLCAGWGSLPQLIDWGLVQVAKQHPALLREAKHLEAAVKAKAAIQRARSALSRNPPFPHTQCFEHVPAQSRCRIRTPPSLEEGGTRSLA